MDDLLCALRSAALSVTFLALSSPAHAAAQTSFIAPIEFNTATSGGRVLTNGTYHREAYDLVGAIVEIVVNRNSNPDFGDTWSFGLREVDTQALLGSGAIQYDALQDCFIGFDGNPVFCNVQVPPEDASTYIYTFSGFFDLQCSDTVNYELLTRLNSADRGGSPHQFRPTEFPLSEPQVEVSPGTLHPKEAGSLGDSATIVVSVEDGIERPGGGNCGIQVPDVRVSLKSTIVPQSGGHSHYSNSSQKGAGQFFPTASFQTTVTPAATGRKPKGRRLTLGS